MLIVAKVIVDVASHQTNQTYDYCIPEQLKDDVGIGYRVRVPFGNRFVQGYVVDVCLQESTQYALKPIHSVMDTYPVLTHELVSLGNYLSETTYAFLINCYHVMLPALLKSDYQKQVTWVGDLHQMPSFFNGKLTVSFDAITDVNDLKTIIQGVKNNVITVTYDVKSKAKHKYVKVIHANELTATISLSNRAKALIKLQETLLSKSPLTQQELVALGISLTTIKNAHVQGWVTIEERVAYRDPFLEKQFAVNVPKVLNDEQQSAFLAIKQSMLHNQHQTYLLQGVTGSGKTEVYLQLIQEVIANGKTALLLVPEIALTPQMVTQFKGRFGDRVAVLHSGLSNGERYDEWVKIRKQEADIVVGARSSIFAPLEKIGVIIIDEEHETTYKQMDTVRYHARDIAIWRGKYHHCPVVLGSATPSLESRARAQKNVYMHLQLTKRANQQALPEVTIVDMTKEKKGGNFDIFSQQLKDAMINRLSKNEQIVLLLNRRGYSSFVMCRDCGYVLECPNCDISMTLHVQSQSMKCHYCGHDSPIPKHCPSCASREIRYYGLGTQKVEEALNRLFPDVKIIRMDVDTTRQKGQHEKLLDEFANGKASILLGTQMIAKGLDFPNITLVGVINADTSLNLPDFRSHEKTFQLLTQVAGRAGRGQKQGEVIIQTYNPDHYVLQLAQTQNYEQFYRQEMTMRKLGKYAPYFFTTLLTITHQSETQALQTAFEVKQIIQQHQIEDILVVGPSPQAVARVNNQYYFQILLKYKNKAVMTLLLDELRTFAQQKSVKKIYVSIDVEPLSFV